MPLAKRVKRELKSKGGMSQPLDLIRQDRLRFNTKDLTQLRWAPPSSLCTRKNPFTAKLVLISTPHTMLVHRQAHAQP